MSPEPGHLADWIRALVAALDAAEPLAAGAIRRLAGDRRAVIGLDAERAAVRFENGRLVIRRQPAAAVPRCAWGATDRATVADILGGHVEVAEAIAAGRLDLRAPAAEVIAMCAILEVLVDASTRIPEMQRLAAVFLASAPGDGRAARSERRARAAARAARERAFLRREGLA